MPAGTRQRRANGGASAGGSGAKAAAADPKAATSDSGSWRSSLGFAALLLVMFLAAFQGGVYYTRWQKGGETAVSADDPRRMLADLEPAPRDSSYGKWQKKAEYVWVSQFNASRVDRKSPVWVFDDFLTEAEADTFIRLGRPNLARSTGGMDRRIDNSRTSSTAWLMSYPQSDAPVVEGVRARAASIVGVPPENQEHFQILHYDKGQYYRAHSDFIEQQVDQPSGARLATFFIYLSDVDEGGQTHFPALGLDVFPKRGRAALWYNLKLDGLHLDDPSTWHPDTKMTHEATPVVAGEKWACNLWVHVGDFLTAWRQGATG